MNLRASTEIERSQSGQTAQSLEQLWRAPRGTHAGEREAPERWSARTAKCELQCLEHAIRYKVAPRKAQTKNEK